MQSDKPLGYQNESVALSNNPVHRHQKSALIQARILVEIEGEIIAKHWLNKPLCTIGRFPTSDIQIASQRVSRFHALIRWKNGAWVIEDAESLNGLTCQGQRIDQLALVNGDRISIDPTIVLQYEEPEA